MPDTTVHKIDSHFSPVGEMGQKYLAVGKHIGMRLWENLPATVGEGEEPSRREYECCGYVISGRAELHVEGQMVTLEPGDSWVVPRGALHHYKILEPLTAVECTCPPAVIHGRDEEEADLEWRRTTPNSGDRHQGCPCRGDAEPQHAASPLSPGGRGVGGDECRRACARVNPASGHPWVNNPSYRGRGGKPDQSRLTRHARGIPRHPKSSAPATDFRTTPAFRRTAGLWYNTCVRVSGHCPTCGHGAVQARAAGPSRRPPANTRPRVLTEMRTAEITRKTAETDITLSLNLDGSGAADIATGVGFFDHMLTHIARHGLFDLKVRAAGDLHVDFHHTVEDVGIVLGQALARALGDKAGIRRFGHAAAPMDESLAEVAVDLSGRAFLVFNAAFHAPKIGEFDVELVEEFFRAFSGNARCNLHVNVRYGRNNHHIAEAIFKAAAKALSDAVRIDPRERGVPSTKGTLTEPGRGPAD